MLAHVPWGLIFTTLAIAGIGIYNLASAARVPTMWMSQSAYLGVGLIAMAAVCLVDYRFFHQWAPVLYGLNLLACCALFVIGHKAKGAVGWFVIGPLRLQPAEFMKIGVILMLARYYHDTHRPSEPSYGLVRLIPPLLIVLVPAAVIVIQPDLGTSMMILLASATVILFGRPKLWIVVALAMALLSVSVVIWNDFVRDPSDNHRTLIRHAMKLHQQQRIVSWLNPEADVRGASYHAVQSMIAVGSGELTGKGWRQGTQTGLSFLPEQHTDFIFSVWAEEHGFLACLLLLLLYGGMLLGSLGVAFGARDRFGAFVAVGVAAMIFWHVFQNIGMVIGLLPVTGITLPLMSYGGSSLVSVLISLGLVVNVGMRRHMFT
ncbi:MAG: rod shape-determining protein RodA [Myxococcaceae bacterium]|nr:rod shape-determining protein RodA [Myxococcaceae bacterium]